MTRIRSYHSHMVAERGHARDVVEQQPTEPSTEKAGSRKAAWRIITSLEQKENTKGNEQQAAYSREYAVKVEAELQKISDGILSLMDKNLIPSESTGDPKVFYYKMKSNFYQYLAECATGDTKSKHAEDAREVHAETTKIAEKALPDLDEACKMARVVFDEIVHVCQLCNNAKFPSFKLCSKQRKCHRFHSLIDWWTSLL